MNKIQRECRDWFRGRIVNNNLMWFKRLSERQKAIDTLLKLRAPRPHCPLYDSIPFDPLEINLILDADKKTCDMMGT